VLLADEVGLGKTIEAGMVLKEYLLRGMAERVLILTPASLVKQWQEEMSLKFGVSFATSHDSLLRRDPDVFWAQPLVIASIATARRPDHLARLASRPHDLVIVDEAHHVKNRATANWKLVDALQKRFLLLLSATPVQNSLVEIYNLLTLLKPGIFKTEKEFRSNYMTSGQPRKPANSERLRDLMRDVMIRNTRALVDVRLPPRHARTIMLDPGEQEAALYQELSRLVQEAHCDGPARRRLSLRHLLAAGGSNPATAAESLGRFVASNEVGDGWAKLRDRYERFSSGTKQSSLCQLLRRNADEKKIVFVHHRATLAALQRLLRSEGLEFVVFEGSMSGPEKDRAIEVFRDAVPLLLSTESGGEGRNLQFCNTIINFDLPWNPMAIEQRIGRVHRIGQTREVFIFNLVVRHTLEERILKILDEKINMFELVVGEIGAILGQMDEVVDFSETVFAAWMETTEGEREKVFANLGDRLADAKSRYDLVKALDAELFGDEFVAA
jgi:SNF2 family DNA or RNA helicase